MDHQDYHQDLVLAQLKAERGRQDEKWGVQHHPDGGQYNDDELASYYREETDEHERAGLLTWRDILLEEVFEALGEAFAQDPGKLREELVQTAAVTVAWIEDIDSRAATDGIRDQINDEYNEVLQAFHNKEAA